MISTKSLKIIIILLFSVLLSGGLWGQEPSAEAPTPATAFELFPQAFGYSFGEMAGNGFAYRQWLGPWGWQLSGLIAYDPNNTNPFFSDKFYHSTGLSLLWTLFAGQPLSWFHSQLYLLGSTAYVGSQVMVDQYGEWTITRVEKPYMSHVHFGLGFGLELGLFKHLSLIFEAAQRAKLQVPFTEKGFDLGPVFQASLLYRF